MPFYVLRSSLLTGLILLGSTAALAQVPQAMPPSPAPGPNRAAPTPAQTRFGLTSNGKTGVESVDTSLSSPLTLQRAISIALYRQNSIAVAGFGIESARQGVTVARSAYYPQVVPNFQYQANLTPQRGGSSNSSSTADGIVAKELILDSGQREATLGQARQSLFAQQYAFADTRQQVILAVTIDYFNLLRDRALTQVQQENVRLQQTNVTNINTQVAAGTEAAVDKLQGVADLANAQVALLQAQTTAIQDEATLKNAMGVISSQHLDLPASETPAAPDTAHTPLPLEAWVNAAYFNRYDVRAQQDALNAEGYNVRTAKLNAGISVQANITEGYEIDPIAGEDRSFVVALSYPLFDGGLTRAQVKAAESQQQSDRRNLDELEQNVRLDVELAYTAREQARQQLVASQAAVAAGDANYTAASQRLREGQGTVLDVLNAEVQLVTARVSLVDAIYGFRVEQAQLERDAGVNDTAYVPSVPHSIRIKAPAAFAGTAMRMAP
ncbi:MAG: TolC family protein [Armatimonadetes bacterium]|nr:TolC family protein [Armatimonadota bacterium]MDE2206951.1 TolC family protein [Armatimonadota bacterium]